MTKLLKFLTMGMIAAAIVPGCSWLRGACAEAVPVLSQIQSYGTDAEAAIDEAAALAAILPVDTAMKAKILSAITTCQEAVRTGMALLSTAASACSQPDVTTIFADLITAWNALEPLLVTTGVMATPDKVATVAIRPPQVVLLARKRAVQ